MPEADPYLVVRSQLEQVVYLEVLKLMRQEQVKLNQQPVVFLVQWELNQNQLTLLQALQHYLVDLQLLPMQEAQLSHPHSKQIQLLLEDLEAYLVVKVHNQSLELVCLVPISELLNQQRRKKNLKNNQMLLERNQSKEIQCLEVSEHKVKMVPHPVLVVNHQLQLLLV